MSVRKRRLVFAADARADLRGILLYTRETWGNEQRARYRAAFERAWDHLRDYPESGPARPDYGPDIRGLLVHEHVVFYRVEADKIRILRVLHQRMDAASHLKNL